MEFPNTVWPVVSFNGNSLQTSWLLELPVGTNPNDCNLSEMVSKIIEYQVQSSVLSNSPEAGSLI